MNAWDNIPTPDLFRELARHWRVTPKRCPECDATLYKIILEGAARLEYERCGRCRRNVYTNEQMRIRHTPSENMLDSAVERFPTLAELNPSSFAEDREPHK